MSLIDSLISSYAAPEKEFTVTLPQGEVFKFKAISDYSELQRLKAEAQKFSDLALNAKKTPLWKDVRPSNQESALAIFFISETLIEPKLEQLDVMKLAKHAGWVVEFLFSEINARQMNHVVTAEKEEIEELKND